MKQLVQKLEKLFGKSELQDLPRRARRGFSLAEMTLVLIVSAFILQTGIEVATSHTKRQITQRTAANMSRMADDVQTYMDRNYFTILADLNAAPNNVIERDWSDLISANLISMNDVPVSPDGGDLRLFFTLRGDTVYSVIMSFDGAASTYSPKPDPNTKFAGRIQRNAPNSLNGWDFTLDVPEIAALTGEDLNGNIGVMRYISMDANVDPYLHRIAIPGRPDLNQMEANLDMGGFDINNARSIDTQNFNVADELAVNGRLSANGIDSTGSAVVSEVDTDELDSDEIATRNLTASGTVQSVNAVSRTFATGSFTGQDASFNQLSTDVLSGGSIFLTTGNYVEINARRINAEQVIADRIFVGDN
jgi:type II secretory pathway pseudopilin PulG